MRKFLMIAVIVAIVYWLIRQRRLAVKSRKVPLNASAQNPLGEDMVKCVQCGIQSPRSEAVQIKGQYFCSPEHSQS